MLVKIESGNLKMEFNLNKIKWIIKVKFKRAFNLLSFLYKDFSLGH